MKVLQIYQTGDGKQFTSREDAKRHELELETMDKLRNLLKDGINSELTRRGNIDNVLRAIIMENAEVRNILASYNKKMPKEEAAAA